MDSQYASDVMEHKRVVAAYMQQVVDDLYHRATVHDNSKLSSEEATLYEQVVPKLKTLVYGSDEYKETVKELGPALEHHYQENTHHPEHYENGINGMTLIDVIEMLCDWKAVVSKSNGDIQRSLEINKERFGISDQLFQILKNSVR